MNINYKQPQFELFPGSSASPGDDAGRSKYFLANLTLSVENLVVLSILGIMVAVFAYSLGVERGKHVMSFEAKNSIVSPLVAVPVPVKSIVVRQQQGVAGIQATRQSSSLTQTTANVATVAPVVVNPLAVVSAVQQKPLNSVVSAFKYTIQVASYADEKFARKAAVDLNKSGFETLIMQKGKYAILCVGKFNKKNEASAVLSKLKSKYKDCLVRSI